MSSKAPRGERGVPRVTQRDDVTASIAADGALDLAEPAAPDPEVHVLRPGGPGQEGIICDTERRGHPQPKQLSPTELVLDATEGFIPLWARGTMLRWRFQERSMSAFRDPAAAKLAIRQLMGEAVLKWGDAAPIRFTERNDAWDFEIVMRAGDNCTINGCVLASAFFPDGGRHELMLYPKMFGQSRHEVVDTLIHEIGHVYGLRHFFAPVAEEAFPSELWGTQAEFSIMNYGGLSELTDADRTDLRRLYQLAWSGRLIQVNGTPIRFVKPLHTVGTPDGHGAFGDAAIDLRAHGPVEITSA
jgi:hypothetical protein